VAIEVAAGAVVVLGEARVGVSGEDLSVADRDAGVEALVMAACVASPGSHVAGSRRPWRPEAPSDRRRGGRSACRTRAAGPTVPSVRSPRQAEPPQSFQTLRSVSSPGRVETISCSVVRAVSTSIGVRSSTDSWGRSWLNQCTRRRVSSSTCSTSRQGPSGRISSVV
jgi:hypothetical protein